jgi:hypothetical protein
MMKERVRKVRLAMVGCLLLAAVALAGGRQGARAVAEAPEAGYETRCGWFSNPTPANASLFDRDGEWIIGVQGGFQAEGDWPEFGPRQWVKTNVNYGHGCACLRVRVDRESERVLEIKSARARPLSACRRDRALRKWGFR